MTVNEVVEATMNRVNGLSFEQSVQRRDFARIEPWEFERLLVRAMEILSIRAQRTTAAIIKPPENGGGTEETVSGRLF